ncbi:Fe2+-enterobactin ABC transporter substrate-binding protein [Allorhizobium undicola]|uniref:Fe2+-enterobactin ABC transporter substrate-binding protein n=1 Tax=Allorhizobium undicola TaxID=78527 RepID=UPI000484C203|nr:Fe2+-enterobactin ABC transporter substrate-binding protein [Allorhizobium undicola]
MMMKARVFLSFTFMLLGLALAMPTARAGGDWPRSFQNVDGTKTEIPAQPKRILSSSVTLTGTLLAIHAPVIASGSATNGTFFAQWAEEARARGVQNVWPTGKVDLEAVYALQPDLIIVTVSGAGAARDQIGAFRQIAPTIVLDDSSASWQALATELGKATGLESEAAATIAEFDAYVAAAREKLKLPEGKTNIISYNGPGQENPIARVSGPHAALLTALGFTMEDPDPSWHTQAVLRHDFVWASYERLVDLKAETTFLLRVDDSRAEAFMRDPVLANLPSVKKGQVYGLGVNSFRMDYYSGKQVVDGIVKKFAK